MRRHLALFLVLFAILVTAAAVAAALHERSVARAPAQHVALGEGGGWNDGGGDEG